MLLERNALFPYLLLAPILASCTPAPREAIPETRPLILKLGADSVDEREWAYARLLALGAGIAVELREGAKNSDPEIASRCQEILGRLLPHDGAVRREVAHWLRHAIRDFDRGAYKQCIVMCDAILFVDPEYPVALTIHQWAEKAQHVDPLYPYEGRFARWLQESDPSSGTLPVGDAFRTPPLGLWSGLHNLASTMAVKVCRAKKEEQDRYCIALILETTPVTLSFKNAPLYEAFEELRNSSGLNMCFDASNGHAEPPRFVTREFQGEKLSMVLDTLLKPLGLEYCVTEENVVLFTKPEYVRKLKE